MTHDPTEALREALEPFATFAKDNVDEHGWTGIAVKNDRIVCWFGPSDFRRAAEAFAALASPLLRVGEAFDLDTVREQVKEGKLAGIGFWQTCTGCHESEDGYDVGIYPFSEAFDCKLGSGCSECGGIGAIWDTTDSAAMGEALSKEPVTPPPGVVEGPLKDTVAMSASAESDRVLQLHFSRPITAADRAALINAHNTIVTLSAEKGRLPPDVIELVIAARIVAYEDQSPEALRDLDKAAEAFSERVPWENDPEELRALTPKDGSR